MIPSLVLRTTTRWLVPAMLVCSAWLLLRGHDQPGGGFVGGLVAVAALLLDTYAAGAEHVRARLRVTPESLLAAGLLIAVLSAVAGPLVGEAWMRGLWWEADLPGVHIALGTPLLFDLGVYLVVIGSSLAVLLPALSEHG